MTSFLAELRSAEWRRRHLPGIVRRAAFRTTVIAILGVLLMAGLAWADPIGSSTGTAADVIAKTAGSPTAAEIAQDLGHLKISTNLFFLMVGVALIFFMQAGFLLVEVGFMRAKNAANIAAMNLGIFGIGALAYFATGFALQMGGAGPLATLGGTTALSGSFALGKGWGLVGTHGFFLGGNTYDVAVIGMFLFQLVFMDTAATIPTGAMAERWKFSAFAVYGLWMAGLLYPVYAMWVWGGGWLSQLGHTLGLGHGALDFAGSGVVHSVGGFVALAGAIVLGPRIGKFKGGKAQAIPGHDIPIAILGTVILTFGWIGFNGMSTLAATDMRFTIIIANTLLAAGAGMVTAMLTVWRVFGKPDPSMMANGFLAGLVGITGSCAFVSPGSAVVIGGVAGFLVVAAVVFVERVLKVDDPPGAVAVHAVCGTWGLIALGLFADGTYGDGFNGVAGGVRGLFFGGGFAQLGAQLISVAVVAVWAFGLGYTFFKLQNALQPGGIRSSAADELAGLDPSEMGLLAYPDFTGDAPLGGGDTPEVPGEPTHRTAPQPAGNEA